MNIWIASDHGGFGLKQSIFNELKANVEYNVTDLGCYSSESCDYPEMAKLVCKHVNEQGGFGILICTTGQGMCMTANAQPGIRAALLYNLETAIMARQHNNANVACIGAKYCTINEAIDWIERFVKTPFTQEERHMRRIEQIKE